MGLLEIFAQNNTTALKVLLAVTVANPAPIFLMKEQVTLQNAWTVLQATFVTVVMTRILYNHAQQASIALGETLLPPMNVNLDFIVLHSHQSNYHVKQEHIKMNMANPRVKLA